MRETKNKILIVEDDFNLGNLISDLLNAEGFQTVLCRDGLIALKSFNEKSFDICLLDVMMPNMDGFTVAKTIRKSNNKIPIIFITAKSTRQDKLTGYQSGGDDYIIKPFDEEELLWKINAMIRRNDPNNNAHKSEIKAIGKYTFDYYNQSLSINGKMRRITEKESNILNYLYSNRNQLIKREQMLKDLWGENDYFLGRSLDVFITKIRKYLSEDPTLTIETVFKVGLIFNVPDENK
jgi:DNA-binding response OmpR family regulator